MEVVISDLAFGGEGVGKLKLPGGDFVVFVEDVAPGDRVQARLFKIKKQFTQAKLVKILEPSTQRITPRCKHFEICGGCTLQFFKYEDQLKWKEKIVKDALRQIGGFGDIEIEPIIGCEDPWFYRNKMEYSFGFEDGATEPKKLALGLHPAGWFKSVFDLEECFLQSPLAVKIVEATKTWAREQNLAPHDPRTNEGILKTLMIREGKNTNEMMVNLITNGRNFPQEKIFSDFITKNFPEVTSLYRTAVTIQRGHRTVVEEFLLAGKPILTETLSVPKPDDQAKNTTLTFQIHPQAFFQTNTRQAQVLYGKILELAQPQQEDFVLDLFCGTGTIGMFFAKFSAKVAGVELNESAIQNAKENAKQNDIANIDFFCGDVSNFLKTSSPPSILITDPPRAGIAPKTLQQILELKIPKWIYVSCNPSTLARDLISMTKNGYQIKKIQPVDMFPHTYHIETICLLQKTA